jgi:hypothetical protein
MQPLRLDPQVCPVEGPSGVGNANNPINFANVVVDLQGEIQIPVYAGLTAGRTNLELDCWASQDSSRLFRITFDLPNRVYHLEIP